MKLTKYAHATVVLEEGGETILIDPGTFTPNAHDLLRVATAVLVTHEHFDHFAVEQVREALDERPSLRIWGPATIAAALDGSVAAAEGRVTTVAGGETFDIGDVRVQVFGGPHAEIHDGITVPHNVGYLVGGKVFHPGDSYLVPDVDVDTLLVPTSGPWVKVGEAIDYIEAVRPRQTVQIHDVMLSDVGRSSVGMFLGERGMTGTPMITLAVGESVDA